VIYLIVLDDRSGTQGIEPHGRRERPGQGLIDKESNVRLRARATNFIGYLALAAALLCLAFAASPAPVSAADACPNAVLRQSQGATALANCRAWEMVSPVAKNNNSVYLATSTIRAASDGQAAAFESLAPFADAANGGRATAYLSDRGPDGWSSHGLNPAVPVDLFASIAAERFLWFSEDLSLSVLRSAAALTPGARREQSNLYFQDTHSAARQLLTPAAVETFPAESVSYTASWSGQSTDLETTYFESPKQLAPGALEGTQNLYRRDSATAGLSVVGVLPDGEVAPGGAAAGTGSVASDIEGQHAISDDGNSAFFTTPGAGYEIATGQIFRRQGEETVPVSGAGLVEAATAQFWKGSTSGSLALFTSHEELTGDAVTGPGNGGNDLYLWREGASPQLIDLSVGGESEAEPNGAEVLGVLGASNDLSYIYFAARGDLAPGATPGASNLYVWHEGSLEYVAGGAVPSNWDLSPGNFSLGGGNGIQTARVTADGDRLLFVSDASPTGYANAGHDELYVFDAATKAVNCVSCDPSGAPASGDASFIAPAEGPGAPGVAHLVHAMSDDGSRVFFNSPEQLVNADSNSQIDVYEWNQGTISLLSSGQSRNGSYFADASADGSDAFFVTYQQLVGQDRDTNRDLYDARIGGGLTGQNAPAYAVPCQGDECRAAAAQPPVSTPASTTLSGRGNVKGRHHRKHPKKKHRGKKQRGKQQPQGHPTRRHG
jgi:hypothetical protein